MSGIRNRNLGEVYTPDNVSDLLYEITNKCIPNFKDTHVVWDCCWGTGNLTYKHDFANLYVSTLRGQDIKRNRKRNPGATKFMYDFLNEDVYQLASKQAMWSMDHTMPDDLREHFELEGDKPILFYINPPYATSGVMGGGSRGDATTNKVKELMVEEGMGVASDQLYCQFIYRILMMKRAYPNKNISIAVVCSPMALAGGTYSKFRQDLLGEFEYRGGALFRADQFPGLSGRWGICIQVWTPGKTGDIHNFEFGLYESEDGAETGEGKPLRHVGNKTVYNLDGETALSDWLRIKVGGLPEIVADATLTSGCKLSNRKPVSTLIGSFGYFFYRSNNIYHNEQECGILSVPYASGGGVPIIEDNLDDVLAAFTARRAFTRDGANWINDKDEYRVPNKSVGAYQVMVDNSIVYSLFNGSSQMTSMIFEEHGIEFENQFFFMGLTEMEGLYRIQGEDIGGPGKLQDRLIYGRLKRALNSGNIMKSGQIVLEEAYSIFRDTFKHRWEFEKKTGGAFQVTHWDAGFYQVKQVLKDRDNQRFLRFNRLYRDFEKEIRDLVYECEYLRK